MHYKPRVNREIQSGLTDRHTGEEDEGEGIELEEGRGGTGEERNKRSKRKNRKKIRSRKKEEKKMEKKITRKISPKPSGHSPPGSPPYGYDDPRTLPPSPSLRLSAPKARLI